MFEINSQFNFIEPISFTIRIGVNNYNISRSIKSGTDVYLVRRKQVLLASNSFRFDIYF